MVMTVLEHKTDFQKNINILSYFFRLYTIMYIVPKAADRC
jgi:hypothetical protein